MVEKRDFHNFKFRKKGEKPTFWRKKKKLVEENAGNCTHPVHICTLLTIYLPYVNICNNQSVFTKEILMLILAKNLKQLSFGQLMRVYEEGNLENAASFWPDLPQGQLLARAEQEFYAYLDQVFFRTPGSLYCIWQDQNVYVSALRLEPYKDGLLLEALETAPDHRRKGHAFRLMDAMISWLKEQGGGILYSHVGKKNTASLSVHENLGFERISEMAVYADGSVDGRCCTLRRKV